MDNTAVYVSQRNSWLKIHGPATFVVAASHFERRVMTTYKYTLGLWVVMTMTASGHWNGANGAFLLVEKVGRTPGAAES